MILMLLFAIYREIGWKHHKIMIQLQIGLEISCYILSVLLWLKSHYDVPFLLDYQLLRFLFVR